MEQTMTKRILIPIASGIEEMETITIADIMVRAGYEVVLASANFDGSLIMKASRGFTLTADCLLVDVADEEFDMVVLPGGAGGCEILRDSALVLEVVKQQHYDGRWVAAICAAPAMVLKHHNLFPDAIMTCHPNFQDKLSPKQRRKKRVTVTCPALGVVKVALPSCVCVCVWGEGGANTARVALKPAQRGAPRQGHPQAPPPQPGRRGLRPETPVSQWRTRNLNGRTRCRVRRNPRLHTPPGRGIPLPRHCGTSKGYPAVSVSPCHTRAAGQCLMRPLKKKEC